MILLALVVMAANALGPIPKAVSEGEFMEMSCKDISNFIIVDVEAADGKEHPFLLDTGCIGQSYISRPLAASLGKTDSGMVQCGLRLKNGAKILFMAQTRDDLRVLEPGVFVTPIEGIVGMSLLQSLQIKIDYAQQRAWCRVSPKTLPNDAAAHELASTFDQSAARSVSSVPLKETPGGWFYFEANVESKKMRIVLDSGANEFTMTPQLIKRMRLDKVVDTEITSYRGREASSLYVAKSLRIGSYPLCWPVVRSKQPVSDGDAVLSSALLPSQQVLIDFPDHRLYFRTPQPEDTLNQAVRQYFGEPVAIDGGILRMNWSDPSVASPGLEVARITSVQGIDSSEWIGLMNSWANGDTKAYPKLLSIFTDIWTNEHLKVVLQDHEIDYPARTVLAGGTRRQ